jgi:hypothetical protein
VAARTALAARGGHADGKVADDFFALLFFLVLDQLCGRERQNIRRLIEAAELAVESADRLVGREEN